MNNEKDLREKQEIKYFAIIVMGILIALMIFVKASSFNSYADEVLVAESPVNVGGNNGSINESFVIDITDGGSNESVQSSAPAIIYDPGLTGRGDLVPTSEPGDDSNSNSSEGNETSGNTSEVNVIKHADPESDTKTEQQINIEEIYVPDSDDDCPVSSLVPLDAEVQQYIWTKCKRTTGDFKNYYAFILGAIQLESDFKRTAIHYNKNGTTDRGLMQINSCNISSCKRAGLISCTDDLWNIFKNIDCGFHEMDAYVKKFGVTESAYYAYNTGRQNGGSNKNSRVVMRNMSYWNTLLFGEGR